MSNRALVTGVSGQDRSILAELLLGKGSEVHGLIHPVPTFNTAGIDYGYRDSHDPEARVFLRHRDMGDGSRW